VKTLTCIPSFCCNSRSNRKTQPSSWLATNNTKIYQKPGKHNRIDKTHRKGQQRRTKTNGRIRDVSNLRPTTNSKGPVLQKEGKKLGANNLTKSTSNSWNLEMCFKYQMDILHMEEKTP
jgi:hypothetical protein